MNSKDIYITQPCVAELVTSELPALGANEVRVKLAYSTVSSGTERANVMNLPNTGFDPNHVEQFPIKDLGYSASGTVDAVGESVTDLQIGDRVAVSWSHHGQYIHVRRGNVYKLPDCVSLQDAALFHIGIFPLAAVRKCRTELGESAIVMGLGVLGLVAVQLLRAAGATPIIAVDPIPEKREKALSLGADFALDPFSEDFAAEAKRLTGGGAAVGIEVTGIGAGLDGILDCMAKFGRVALLGCTRNKDFTIDYYRKVHAPGITLIGAHTAARPKTESHGGWWTQKDDMQALLRLHATGRLSLGSLVDEVHSPAAAPGVYDRLVQEKAFPVVQFDWQTL